MKPLFIPLLTVWFAEFKAGRKTIEYRAYGPRWNERTCNVGREAVLSKGYSGDRIVGSVRSFRRIPLDSAPPSVQEYFQGHDYLAEIALDINL